jgi:hypothetical protein
MAAKHFMIYYGIGTGTYIVTEPRPWARENQNLFPNFTFEPNNHPTTNFIEDWLIENRNFVRVFVNDDIIVIQNLNPNLIL